MTADPSLISKLSWCPGAICPWVAVPLEGEPINTPASPIPIAAAMGRLRTTEQKVTNLSDCAGVPPRPRTITERITPIGPSRSAAPSKYMYNTTHFLDCPLIASDNILLSARHSNVSQAHGRSRYTKVVQSSADRGGFYLLASEPRLAGEAVARREGSPRMRANHALSCGRPSVRSPNPRSLANSSATARTRCPIAGGS